MGGSARQRTVALTTLGCKINQYDTNALVAGLRREGHVVVEDAAEAEVVVVNTCTVTARTDYKGRQLVRRVIQENPRAIVVVTGCYAEVQAEALARIPGVDYVHGNAEKIGLAARVAGMEKQATPQILAGNVGEERALEEGAREVHSGTTRAFLKIQDGCDQACTYCIIPRARGPSRSLPLDRVLEKSRALAREGFQEVVLSGIHLGRYGQDLSSRTHLGALLQRLEAEGEVPRVRISSIEPNELTDGILSLFSGARHLCPHFHLPLQSGDASILRAMGRPYGPEAFAARVHRIREQTPDAAIGVDVIAGFPGEGSDAFRRTVDLLEALPVSYLHVFPYSPRPGTPAARFTGRVPPEAIRRRAGTLRDLGLRKRLAFYGGSVGAGVEVLVETRRDPHTGMLRGMTRNYLPVHLEGPDTLQGKRVPAHIRALRGRRLFGERDAGTGPEARATSVEAS